MLGFEALTVRPRRGQLLVFDKLARPLVLHVLLARAGPPRQRCAGRADRLRDVMLGPTAEDLERKTTRVPRAPVSTT